MMPALIDRMEETMSCQGMPRLKTDLSWNFHIHFEVHVGAETWIFLSGVFVAQETSFTSY